MYRGNIRDVEPLRERLIEELFEEWNNFHHKIIISAIAQWHIRLRACMQAKDGRFEQSVRHCREKGRINSSVLRRYHISSTLTF